MKKGLFFLIVACLLLLAACVPGPIPADTIAPTDPMSSPAPTQSPTETPTQAPTHPQIVSGWVETDGGKRYYLSDGTAATGWLDVDGNRYYFAEGGLPWIGWLEQDGKRYFLGMDGILRTGWIETDAKRYYMDPESGGAAHTGWLEDGDKRYYLDENGEMQTGWLTLEQTRYYLRPDGSLARGKTQIDGRIHWFTNSGTEILLVNPWNYMPEDYAADLVSVGNGHRVDRQCYDALMQMLADCRAAGLDPQVASSYRTHDYQIYLYDRKVNYYLGLGYSEAEAKKEAATVIAVPGTSEHELGLAVDLVDNSNWNLDESQEKTPVQQWLMKNSWRYGFVLRYPNGKSDVTGIIYEPWHYRYVGETVAKELHDSGMCLEEYLNALC